MPDARLQAVLILTEVLKHERSLTAALERGLGELAGAEQSLVKNICFGVMREYFVLDKCLSNFLKKPVKAKELVIKILLLIGIYQLKYMRIPDHAAINETVAICKKINKTWARSLVNAVLRKVQKDNGFKCRLEDTHPGWLVHKLKQSWPEDYLKIIKNNQQRPPMSLRVNLQKTSRDAYLELLAQHAIKAQKLAYIESALNLVNPRPVDQLPGFSAGMVSVQDAAAQLSARLLNPEKSEKILDACAAPGGKSSHILELAPAVDLICLDNVKSRLEKIKQNLQRLGQKAHLLTGDASNMDWWDGKLFDKILLDAPCSATGVIRRNPDVKVLRTPGSINELVRTQSNILNNIWRILKPGGILLYTTCSILPEENEMQIAKFLQENNNARELKIEKSWLRSRKYGAQSLTVDNDWDNFYYARIQKKI